MKIVFIGCVKSKEDHRCQAKDLYISPLFEKSFFYAQQLNPDRIYILSAKHHLLPIDKVISPYDLTLKDMSADERREWGGVCISMMEKEGIKPSDDVTFLCGEIYLENIREYFNNPKEPLKGLALGESMHWLDEHTNEQNKKFSIITMSLINRLKLAKMLLKFGSLKTDKGELQYEGELAEGLEVFIEVDGELQPAENGEYIADDKTIVVEGGKIASITETTKPEETEDQTEEVVETEAADETTEVEDRTVELEAKITELEAIIAERDARIAELEAQLAEKEAQLKMSINKPAHEEVKTITNTNKENKALRFFN